ncbi:heterogeneous nuclear ribonucleoprotein K-like [Actinia tenebrosa]|uniref:Heterogeneous nuclear ribonucleoprotein K-like n=1 Tax=Actinia tenebrosa TaxID=6105 RepID=A0A6P8HZM3_ACTTE|nr:heterogeneous nuclear ribonucleoprotein K-like [Actinia tenebrosa]
MEQQQQPNQGYIKQEELQPNSQYDEGTSEGGDQSGSLKRFAEGDYNGNNKRFKQSGGPDGETTIRILLQSKDAGGIIGKSGSNIKRLRSEYNAVVNVPDTNYSERVLTITASTNTALAILGECVPKIGEHSRGGGNPTHDIQLLVQRSQVGSIIGRAGYKIKEIREQSGANIKVFSDCLPNSTERVVAITGTIDTVVKCVEIIYETLESTPLKGQVILYDPSMQGGYDDWGYGYDGPDGRGGAMGGRGGQGRNVRGGSRGGGRGSMNRSGRGGRGGRGGFSAGGGQGGMFGGSGDFSQDIGGFNEGSNFGGGMNQWNQGQGSGDQPTTSTQVTIPKDLAGSIIGKGGERIRSIRNKCRATIKIDDPLPGADDRIITITGTQDEINYAQYLLQQSVRQFSGKKF